MKAEPPRVGRRHALAAAIAALAPAAGCSRGPRAAPAAPRAPAFLGPGEFLPADLDLVVRLDAARLRSLASDPSLRALLLEHEQDHPWLGRAFAMRASSLWVGFRGEPDGTKSDTVLVVQGDLRSWKSSIVANDEPSRPWRLQAMPAPGLNVYERAPSAADRSSPVRLTLVRERIGVLASAAEADAVDRILAGGPELGRLEPPADGALGFALRPRSLLSSLEKKYPSLSRLAAEVQTVRGSADLETDALRADATVDFQSGQSADRAEKVLRTALDEWGQGDAPRLKALARSSSLRREGPAVVRWAVRARGDDARALAGAPPAPKTSPAPPAPLGARPASRAGAPGPPRGQGAQPSSAREGSRRAARPTAQSAPTTAKSAPNAAPPK